MHVLRAEADVGDGIEQFADGGESGEGRTEDDFSFVELADLAQEVLDEWSGPRPCVLFIFPVTGDNFFAMDHKLKWGMPPGRVPEAEDFDQLLLCIQAVDDAVRISDQLTNVFAADFRNHSSGMSKIGD